MVGCATTASTRITQNRTRAIDGRQRWWHIVQQMQSRRRRDESAWLSSAWKAPTAPCRLAADPAENSVPNFCDEQQQPRRAIAGPATLLCSAAHDRASRHPRVLQWPAVGTDSARCCAQKADRHALGTCGLSILGRGCGAGEVQAHDHGRKLAVCCRTAALAMRQGSG